MIGLVFSLSGFTLALVALTVAIRGRLLVRRGLARGDAYMVARGRRLALLSMPLAVAVFPLGAVGVALSFKVLG